MLKWIKLGIVCGFVFITDAVSAQSFDDLLGRSFVVNYEEILKFPSGNIYKANGTLVLYVSQQRHIFLRLHYIAHFGNSGSETESSSFDTSGDEQGNGPGGRTRFRWDGSSLIRFWTDKTSGDRLTEKIIVDGAVCRFERERESARVIDRTLSQKCVVKGGNALN